LYIARDSSRLEPSDHLGSSQLGSCTTLVITVSNVLEQLVIGEEVLKDVQKVFKTREMMAEFATNGYKTVMGNGRVHLYFTTMITNQFLLSRE